MAGFRIPTTGTTKWHVESEWTWGISPFITMEIDWAKGSGDCYWGKQCKGQITRVVVNRDRTGFTAAFAIMHTHREERAARLTGTMTVTIKNPAGRIAMRIAGMKSWKDNTTFEAQRVEGPKPYIAGGGKNFDVTMKTGASGKLAAQAIFGNLHVRDRDRQIEQVYPMVTVGSGLAVGVTLYSSTSFADVRLPFPCRNWSGAVVDLVTGGTNVIIGSNHVLLNLTLVNGQKVRMESSGFGIGADISINWGSQLIGSLGPKTIERPF
jgi:hypothetical protein